MDITNFDRTFRIGSKNFPATLDVEPISIIDEYGVMATCYTSKGKDQQGYSQFRKHNEQHEVCLFVFAWDDITVPIRWRDSTVIWDSREQ